MGKLGDASSGLVSPYDNTVICLSLFYVLATSKVIHIRMGTDLSTVRTDGDFMAYIILYII